MKTLIISGLILFAAGSSSASKSCCAPPASTPVASANCAAPAGPTAVDTRVRGNVYVDTSRVVKRDTEVFLNVSGNLPTPCHEAAWKTTIKGNAVHVELYSLVDPKVMCVQTLKPVSLSIPIRVTRKGQFQVWLNGKKVGSFRNR